MKKQGSAPSSAATPSKPARKGRPAKSRRKARAKSAAVLAASIDAVEATYPELHAVLKELVTELAVSEIDPESAIAKPAAALVAAFAL